MTDEQKTLILMWISAWGADDRNAQERVNLNLKTTGLWAYESGSGFPTVGHWYNGPIKPGMLFRWNPDQSNQRCRVTRVVTGGDEAMVWSVDSAGGPEVYNEESHFRSMVVPLGLGV